MGVGGSFFGWFGLFGGNTQACPQIPKLLNCDLSSRVPPLPISNIQSPPCAPGSGNPLTCNHSFPNAFSPFPGIAYVGISPGTICLKHFIAPAQLKVVGGSGDPPRAVELYHAREHVCCLPERSDKTHRAACYLPLSSLSRCLLPLLFTLLHHHRLRSDVEEQSIHRRAGRLDVSILPASDA